MNVVKKILLFIFFISIPLVSIMGSANIVLRLPDVYQYEFKSENTVKNIDYNLEISNEELGEKISNYMMGKNKVLILNEIDEETGEYTKKNLLTNRELYFINKTKKIIDIQGIATLILIALSVLYFIIKFMEDEKKHLREISFRAINLYIVMMIVYIVKFILITRYSPDGLIMKILGYNALETDILVQFITKSMTDKIWIAVGALSTIIMVIIEYIIFKITAPKKIFSR